MAQEEEDDDDEDEEKKMDVDKSLAEDVSSMVGLSFHETMLHWSESAFM